MKVNGIKSSKQFQKDILCIAKESGISYMDALLEYSESANIELEIVAAQVRRLPKLKQKLMDQCVELNLVDDDD